jgi:hypothetical protein
VAARAARSGSGGGSGGSGGSDGGGPGSGDGGSSAGGGSGGRDTASGPDAPNGGSAGGGGPRGNSNREPAVGAGTDTSTGNNADASTDETRRTDPPGRSDAPNAPADGATSGDDKRSKKAGSPKPKRSEGGAGKQRDGGAEKSDRMERELAAEPNPETDSDDDVVVTGDLPDAAPPDNGTPVATMTGVGLLALLGAGAGVTAWRRRRS